MKTKAVIFFLDLDVDLLDVDFSGEAIFLNKIEYFQGKCPCGMFHLKYIPT